jgi:hypothetical protein
MTRKKDKVIIRSSRRRPRHGEYCEVEIDKDKTPIALHPSHQPNYKYPFDDMEIGDSFTVPFSITHREIMSLRVARFQKKNGVKKFTTRSMKEEQATRVWRIK